MAATQPFDEKRLATAADWAALDSFDVDEVMQSMDSKVDETYKAMKAELEQERAAKAAAKKAKKAAAAAVAQSTDACPKGGVDLRSID